MEEEFFADFNEFFGESRGSARSQKGQDIYVQLDIEFMEAVEGVKK